MAVEQITYRNIDPKVRNLIMVGLCLAMLCACFDGTIIGTCGPTIAQSLGNPGLYTWMITAYLLCECIMIPIAGKMSDLYGRKLFFLVGLFIFVAGSFVAGMSTNMEMLVICRGIQGIGGGILIPVATAAIADLYAPEARAKMQGVLAAIFGVGSGIGPIIGGYIAENIDWRWCFYINVPIAIVSFILTMKKFPMPELKSKPVIDYAGITFLTIALACLIIIFEMGGTTFAWASIEILALFVVMVAALIVFIKIETVAKEPIISPAILKNRTVVSGSIFMLIFGIGMMGAMTFGAYFGIYVLFDGQPLTASYYTLFMIAGMVVGAGISGKFCERVGYRPWIVVGPVIAFLALALMSMMPVDGISIDVTKKLMFAVHGDPLMIFIASQVILGFGLGLMMTPIMAAVQNSSKEEEIGMNTSTVNLFRSIGTALGTALFTLLINAKYVSEVGDIPGTTDKATEFLSAVYYYLGFIDPMAYNIDMANAVMKGFVNSVEFGFLAGGVIILFGSVIGATIKVKTLYQQKLEAGVTEESEVSEIQQ